MVAVAASSALLVGFLAGLISFKVKSRWCPHCGSMTTAEVPTAPRPAQPRGHAGLVDSADAVLQPGRAGRNSHTGSAAPRERRPMMLVPRTQHQPDRPTWDCLVCGGPWPCAPGKVELAEQGTKHPRALRLYLESCVIDMIDDRADGHRPNGRDDAVYDRVLGWLDASARASGASAAMQ